MENAVTQAVTQISVEAQRLALERRAPDVAGAKPKPKQNQRMSTPVGAA